MASTLQVIDYGALAAGAVCCLAYLGWLSGTGRWRNPLAGVPLPQGGPGGLETGLAVIAFLMLPYAAIQLVAQGLTWDELIRPGSHAWHVAQSADSVAKMVLSLLMLALLARARAAETRVPASSARSQVGVSLVGILILLPLVTTQLKMGTTVWEWIQPEITPPEHPVLEAIEHSAWGPWGTVQLLLGALVIAPLTEELLFRGLILQTLCRTLGRGWLAIALSAVAFGWIHLVQPQAVLPLITMGLIQGYVRLRTGSLAPCILIHILFNARTMTFNLLAAHTFAPV